MNTSTYLCDQCQHPCATCQTTVDYCLICAVTYTIDLNTHTCSCLTSQYEVNVTPQTCQNCTSPCATCILSATNCGSCLIGLNRNLQTNQCVCDDGYYENTTCQPCQEPCIYCTSLSVCTSCKDPTHQSGSSCDCQPTYFLNASFMCQNCVAPCQNCTSESLCISCVQNYYISGNICLQYTSPCYNCVDLPTKCTSCVDSNITPINNVCSNGGCSDGYFMDESLNCLPCIHPCLKCQTYGEHCLECATTFEMSTITPNICVCPAQKYLVVTNNPTDCQSCTQPCDTCSGTADHCLTCIDVNQTVDASNECQCNPGFSMNGVNCVACQDPCLQCQGSPNYCTECKDIQHYISNGQCICNPGYINDYNYNCIPCQPPCTTYSCTDPNHLVNASFQCICKDTYYSNTINTCASCVQPCELCDINGCLTCIDTNQIINSSKNCVCKSGYYQVGLNCSQCVTPCQTCVINQDHCLTCTDIHQTQINNLCICNDGYFDVNHICQQCQYPCIKCELQKDHCLECLDLNHDLISNKCVCKYGFGSSGINNINCSLCQYPCLDCSSSVNICLSCIDNNRFKLENNKCVCKQGYFDTGTDCLQCSSQCSTCSEQSNKCLSCSDPNHQLQLNDCYCKPGYYTDNYKNCLQCQYPCLTCNQDFCISCQDGYNLVEGQCKCEEGYYYIDFYCEQCNQNCSKCNSQFECTECIDQYYLQNTQCLKCQIPCLECLDIQTCKTCSDNYIIDDQGKCTQCIQHCEYFIDSTNCVKCFDEFYYHDQACIPCSDQCQTCVQDSKFCTSCKDSNHILIKKTGICYQKNNFGDLDDYNNLEQILLLQDIRCNQNQLLIGYECINQCGNGLLNEQFEQCDDGNQLGGDGCSLLCIQEDSYQCKHYVNSPSICSFIQAPDFRLNHLSNQYNQTQIIELSFTQKVKIPTNLSFEEIALISIIPQTRININILNITSLSTELEYPLYQVIVEFIEPVEDAYLQIEFDQSIIKNEYDLDLIRHQMQIKLGNPFILSQQNQKKLTQIVLLNDAIIIPYWKCYNVFQFNRPFIIFILYQIYVIQFPTSFNLILEYIFQNIIKTNFGSFEN
ncbi:unnamed protein product [Paramecium pentaurelia]|uniref:EGF-like domain-containing protein n=1 Tax=Paramecium pentaurelia TaxID=43138 RepID=A0A8S1YIY9_9CILI|nr:unnamed protein product [Paramecium pentaurelia]